MENTENNEGKSSIHEDYLHILKIKRIVRIVGVAIFILALIIVLILG